MMLSVLTNALSLAVCDACRVVYVCATECEHAAVACVQIGEYARA
jgi:hypothetical protein